MNVLFYTIFYLFLIIHKITTDDTILQSSITVKNSSHDIPIVENNVAINLIKSNIEDLLIIETNNDKIKLTTEK